MLYSIVHLGAKTRFRERQFMEATASQIFYYLLSVEIGRNLQKLFSDEAKPDLARSKRDFSQATDKMKKKSLGVLTQHSYQPKPLI